MNNVDQRFSGGPGGERQLNAHQRPQSAEGDFAALVSDDIKFSFRRLTATVVVVFWVLQYFGLTFLYRLMYPDAVAAELPRGVVSALCALLSFGMVAAQNRLRPLGLTAQALAALVMAILCPLLVSMISTAVFPLFPGPPAAEPTWAQSFQTYLYRVWIFASLSAIILALSYASDVREREQRIIGLQALAHSAQLRALRNQLNPHFLFNALNSIAALMSKNHSREAEAMTENLADFLRVTLALDPTSMITLDQELGLQRLYLDIQKIRFPDRLRIHVDTPHDLKGALVPSLITQPLIENSIKYAVARSTSPVLLNVIVRSCEGVLQVTIEDDGGDAEKFAATGCRLGLNNVTERLRAHFGEAATLLAAPRSSGGFSNLIKMPLRFS